MPWRSRLSIPHELHQIKAQQIYEQRIAKGKNGCSEGDWETARRYLTKYPKVVRAWEHNQEIAFYRQLPRSFFRSLTRSFKDLINGIWQIITFPFWLFYGLPQQFANMDTRSFALDVVKTIISAASLIAAIIAAIGLFVNYQDALKNRELTQERLITDRFTKAVEQLGNSKEEVVIGGIYSLERIAKDSPKDQWTIMEILTAFVRKNCPITTEIKKIEVIPEKNFKALETLNNLEPLNIQTQAALTVIGRRNVVRDYTSIDFENLNYAKFLVERLDLSNSNLMSAYLRSVNLSGANLSNTYLSRADLTHANFSSANFSGANLTSAVLNNTNLSGAFLSDTFLFGAILGGANLSGAILSGADLSGAILSVANLSGANLSGTNLNNQQIKTACFWEKAIYTDATFNTNVAEAVWIAVDKKANQKRIQEIEQDKASDPENHPDCNKWLKPTEN